MEYTSSASLLKSGSIPFHRLFPREGCNMAKLLKLMIDGIAYTAAVPENTVTDVLCFQGPIELQLKRYADQEYYAPLPNPLPFSSMPLTTAFLMQAGSIVMKVSVSCTFRSKMRRCIPIKLCTSATLMKTSAPIWQWRAIPSAPKSKSFLPESNLPAVRIETDTRK